MEAKTSATHSSWVPVTSESHFPIQNLPYGVFTRHSAPGLKCIGVAIGDMILDLAATAREGLLGSPSHFDTIVFQQVCELISLFLIDKDSLNAFMATGKPAWQEARRIICIH